MCGIAGFVQAGGAPLPDAASQWLTAMTDCLAHRGPDGQGQLVKTPEAAAKAAAGKPQPAPDGTRRQGPKGEIEVTRAGRWVPE